MSANAFITRASCFQSGVVKTAQGGCADNVKSLIFSLNGSRAAHFFQFTPLLNKIYQCFPFAMCLIDF